MLSPKEIVDTMLAKDYFSKWLGIEIIEIKPSYCKLQMIISKNMLNGFGIAHGGITYSLADTALAFAANSQGQKAVSVETSISHLIALHENEIIMAEAIEESRSKKIAIYTIRITAQKDSTLVALFKGTVYITSQNWLNSVSD